MAFPFYRQQKLNHFIFSKYLSSSVQYVWAAFSGFSSEEFRLEDKKLALIIRKLWMDNLTADVISHVTNALEKCEYIQYTTNVMPI